MEWCGNTRAGVPRELSELRRPAGEKSPGEPTAEPRDRPLLLVARGVEPGPTPASGPLRDPGPGVRGEGTAGNMTAGHCDDLDTAEEKHGSPASRA